MKNKVLALGGLVTLLCAGAAYSLHAQVPTNPTGPVAFGEKHPEIRKALRALNNAETALQHADHDFAGHREKALDLTQHAIKECQEALAADKK